MMQVNGVSHRYAGKHSLEDISFNLDASEKTILLGSNGSGKSTLLKILNGLIKPTSGQVQYNGHIVSPRDIKHGPLKLSFRREVALLFQNPDVMLFNPTVYDEIAFGPRQLGLNDLEDRVRHWATLVGVEKHLSRAPFTLSGGEKQKVALAALLIIEPKLLLLDEPAAALDPRSTGWLVDFLAALPIATLTTTHNLSLAPELGRRALVLAEDHHLLYDGPIEPFLKDMNGLLAANLVHSHRHRHGVLEHQHYHIHDWQ